MLIAVCSSDGVYVDRHFGRADEFLVYKVNSEGRKHLVEKRPVDRYWNGYHVHKFDAERMDAVYNVVRDCEILICAAIGPKPAEALRERGLEVITYEGKVENIYANKKES